MTVFTGHAADVDADDPGERERQHADVQAADAADDHGQRERAHGNDGEVHAGSRRSEPISSAACSARTPVKSAIWWRHDVPLATSTVSAPSCRAAGSSRRSPMARETSK